MERRIGNLGVLLLVLFLALFAQLAYLQVYEGPALANHPGNTRNAVRDFGQARGTIRTSDGRIVAESVRNPDAGSKFRYLRRYPGGVLYGHLSGYFSFTYGSSGVERSYNALLAGREGALVISADKLKQLLSDRTTVSDVTLTIDDKVQRVAAQALGRRKGSVVAIDVRDGSIIAMVSYPGYDPTDLALLDQKKVQAAWNKLAADPLKPLLARAFREVYPPGSTFKTITTAAGLQSRVASIDTTYPVIASLALPLTTRPLRNFGGKACGGTLFESFVVSCNTTFAQLGLDLGPAYLGDRARAFGFGRRPPLDVEPGAVASRFPDNAFFTRNTPALAQAAIGQGEVAATPLQMALVAAAIANGGKAPNPHVVSEVRERTGAVVKRPGGGTWTDAMEPAVAAQLRDAMIQVVQRGTATRAALPGVQVAAKTGTAQTANARSHAWTIAFAPAEAPRVAIAVIIEDQNEVSTTTGGRIAAPVVATVLKEALFVTR